MWDNLGRIAGEYPHSVEFLRDPSRIEPAGEHYVKEMQAKNQAVIFFSGHIGNWELTYPLMANVTFDAGLLDTIDHEAMRRGLTRSAFLASAAREKIEAGR